MSTNTVRKWQEEYGNPQVQQSPKRQVKIKIHKKRWVTTGEKFLYSVFSGVMVTSLFFVVSFSSSTDTLNREVQALQQKVQQQQNLNQNLEYKVKELSNPDRILEIAKENGLKIQNTQVKQANPLNQ